MNKKTKIALTIAGIALLPVLAFAQPHANVTSINQLLDVVKTVMWTVFTGIAIIMFVVAGITFLTAQGAPDKVAQARSSVIWGVAGIVVAILAYSIIQIVETML